MLDQILSDREEAYEYKVTPSMSDGTPVPPGWADTVILDVARVNLARQREAFPRVAWRLWRRLRRGGEWEVTEA